MRGIEYKHLLRGFFRPLLPISLFVACSCILFPIRSRSYWLLVDTNKLQSTLSFIPGYPGGKTAGETIDLSAYFQTLKPLQKHSPYFTPSFFKIRTN